MIEPLAARLKSPANAFYSALGDWELQYVNTCNKYQSPVTEGDEVEVATRLFQKYTALAELYYNEEDSTRTTSSSTQNYENLGKK